MFYALAVIFVTTLAQTTSAKKVPYMGDWCYLSERFGHGQQQGQYLINVERCILNQIYTDALGHAGDTIQKCATGNRYDISNIFS